MKFSDVVKHAIELLRESGRLTYRTLKREFDLDDAALEDLKFELIEGQELAVDKDGTVLVWTGTRGEQPADSGEQTQAEEPAPARSTPSALSAEAERRQLTVLFCDLVGSTALSAQLDPEDYRGVVQQYQQTCTAVIQQHDGYLAQYLGDGLLVYFGYPTAHEDDARRAVRTGLGIVEELQHLNTRLSRPLQVRIGLHTGLVVVGEIGSNDRRELLALGETPNVAARIQGLAEPDTVIISAVTQRLIDGQFECQPFGSHLLKGLDTPLAVYHVESERPDASPLAGKATLTPLVGREQEVGLLYDRWEQTKEGRGQVVLLSGEPGIGKSRLAYTLKEHVTNEGSLLFQARCSPYHQHSALYPLIEVLQRTLLFTRQDTDEEKVQKLERTLTLYNMQETAPFFTVLLSLPTPSQYPPLNLTPQKQKERTFQTLLQLLVAQAERQATVFVWEDLHWADPSSLEFLTLLVEQIPTTKLLLVVMFRPEFTPPWKMHSHLTQLTLNRLGQKQVEAMIEKVAETKNLPAEIIKQIRVKTDGVPLFVEELTKTVLDSVESIESIGSQNSRAFQAIPIPATLHDALMSRLDRLSTARQVAQLGATLGREFSYELLHAVTPISETDLQTALAKLVEVEILYQRGIGEQARYFFKHALIQDTAYQSLLKSTRQQYHQQIARVLEECFPDTQETQPELLAHHYTEADLIEQAIPYWQQAGQRAVERSANAEAISHLTRGLELLKTLPDTPERIQQELVLQIALGVPLIFTKGHAAPEVGQVYSRARELGGQAEEPAQLFSALLGLRRFYGARGASRVADELGEQLLSLAQKAQDVALISRSHLMLTETAFQLGEFARARDHAERGIARYDRQLHGAHAFQYGNDVGVTCFSFAALILWLLGYPDQALKRIQEALGLARELAHPFSLCGAFTSTALLHQFRCEPQGTQEWAEVAISVSAAQGFPLYWAWGTNLRGWALAECERQEEGIALMRHGLAAYQRDGGETLQTLFLASLAEVYGKTGVIAEGLLLLSEALRIVDESGVHMVEAELYRLKGELTLQQSNFPREAEACFLKAIEISRKQQAKSLELRTTVSLARLWQRQGKPQEAHQLLAEIYGWFTEGFDTKDLQEAKALLDELAEGR